MRISLFCKALPFLPEPLFRSEFGPFSAGHDFQWEPPPKWLVDMNPHRNDVHQRASSKITSSHPPDQNTRGARVGRETSLPPGSRTADLYPALSIMLSRRFLSSRGRSDWQRGSFTNISKLVSRPWHPTPFLCYQCSTRAGFYFCRVSEQLGRG